MISALFRDNAASTGAGLANEDNATARLSRVVFQGNAATGDGGGLYNRNTARATLTRPVFRKNEAVGVARSTTRTRRC